MIKDMAHPGSGGAMTALWTATPQPLPGVELNMKTEMQPPPGRDR